MMIPLMKTAFLREEETKRALADFIISAPRLSMAAKCREFEHKFLDDLFASVDEAAPVFDQLDRLVNRIREDCE